MEIVLFIILLTLVIFILAHPYIQAEKETAKWAQENDYEIVTRQARFFRTGPYFLMGNAAIHRIELKDKENNSITAWSKSGSGIYPCSKEFRIEVQE